MGNASQINRSRNSVRVERRSDLNESDLGEVYCTYILLDISVVNSHATLAYECELLAVTWHYLPSVRLDNARSAVAHLLRVLILSLRLF